MKKIVIIGATSGIAIDCARQWAKKGSEIYLVARNIEKLKTLRSDLLSQGAGHVHIETMDINDVRSHQKVLNNIISSLFQIDIALIAVGTLPDQKVCESELIAFAEEFNTNAVSIMSFLTLISNHFEKQRVGSIGVISSVAGDRGRPSNYVYGSAKAALSTFCEGLRARLYKCGVSLTDIKPGFVDTPMTRGLDLPKVLVSSTDKIAELIVIGIKKKKNVLYAPSYWWLIMFIIKAIPQFIFKKVNL